MKFNSLPKAPITIIKETVKSLLEAHFAQYGTVKVREAADEFFDDEAAMRFANSVRQAPHLLLTVTHDDVEPDSTMRIPADTFIVQVDVATADLSDKHGMAARDLAERIGHQVRVALAGKQISGETIGTTFLTSGTMNEPFVAESFCMIPITFTVPNLVSDFGY